MALTFTPASDALTCPDFSLPTTHGKLMNKQDLMNGKPFLVVFMCNHCPYVQAIEERLIQLGHTLNQLQVPMLGISSNDEESHPEDSFDEMKKRAEEKKYSFAYAQDKSQEVAKAFGAVCTPDFFLFSANGTLAWRGRLDNNWKDAQKVTQQELLAAVHALLNGTALPEEIPSMGCSIKWKK